MTTRAGEAWSAMLASLAEAAAVVEGPLGARTDRERAEGYRHLTRVLSIACEMLLEKGDTSRPEFTRWMNPHRKMLGDNPGTIYDAALIDPSSTYRITGRRGTEAYLGICVYGTDAGGGRRIVGNIDDVDMAVGEDGSFEVWLSATPRRRRQPTWSWRRTRRRHGAPVLRGPGCRGAGHLHHRGGARRSPATGRGDGRGSVGGGGRIRA